MFGNLMYEPPQGGSYDGELDWESQALCREYDSKLFLLSENPEDRQINKDHFEIAEVICSHCPVLVECWKSATNLDKRVTMRAGAWPTEYRDPAWKPRVRGTVVKTECRNGHDLTVSDAKNARGECVICNRERSRRRRDRLAAEPDGV